MTVPRSGVQAFALALGLSETAAGRLLRSLPPSERYDETDVRLRATAYLAEAEAASSLTDADIAQAAQADEPRAALRQIIADRSERRLMAQLGAHVSWANTVDRSARTAPARTALEAKFLEQADGDPVRAAHLRKAYYARLALKSAQARRSRRRS